LHTLNHTFLYGTTTLSVPELPHYRGFMNTPT